MKPLKPSQPDPIYICPMHPGERSNEPGRCGICHMFLELAPAINMASLEWYFCPDHAEPQYTSRGKCPKCGKDLLKA